MTLRTWAADRALALACWLEPRQGGAASRGTGQGGRCQNAHRDGRLKPKTSPGASSRKPGPDRPSPTDKVSVLFSVPVPPILRLPSAAPAAALLRVVADEMDLGIVRSVRFHWPTDSGGLCAAVMYPAIEGEA